jgi:hypothetical protein
MQHGSDANKRNDFGDDALQTAALRGHITILDFLIEDMQPDARRRADMYSLMASNCVDEKHDVALALNYWRQAAQIRQLELADDVDWQPLAPNAAYGFFAEAMDTQSLADMARNADACSLHAGVVGARSGGSTLGPGGTGPPKCWPGPPKYFGN